MDRGLPSDAALLALARTYLETQRRLWPQLVHAGELPEVDDDALRSMADEFRSRFLDELNPIPRPNALRPNARADAAIYIRFSSDHSNPRSLDQQLRLTLERARPTGHFVPWPCVFADSGVTGTIAARRGYQLLQDAFKEHRSLKALYFDDLSRLSRDMAESTRFCRSLHESGVRVLGASDGFDTAMDQYKAILGVSGLVHEFYIDGLKKKVERGLVDGFLEGKNLQPPAFGYHLVPVTAADGRPLLNRKRQQQLELCVHEEEARIVREIFQRYLNGGQSLQAIARWLNGIAAGGRRAWGASQVAGLLDRRIYIGIQIRGMTRQKKNRETGKITHEKRPRSEWQVRRARHLQIIDWKTWKVMRKLRAERSVLFEKGSPGRVRIYPTRLLSLVCGGCGAAMILSKSGKYAQVRCPNAAEGKRGCGFGGDKSLKKIEEPVLRLVRETLTQPGLIERLVREANAQIEEMASAPKPDLVPLEARVRELLAEGNRLVEAIASSESAVAVLAPRLEVNQRKLSEARAALSAAKASSGEPPEPLTVDVVRAMLSDLMGLLGQEARVAAPVLRELLGEVVITQQREPGRDKPVWYAEFSCDFLNAGIRQQLRKEGNEPMARLTNQIISSGSQELIRLRLDPLPKPEKVTKVPPYIQHADAASKLREEGLTFKEIGERLGVHEVTAMRACDHARPDQRPVKGKKRPQGGKSELLRRRLVELFAAGASLSEAARQAGCTTVTAWRVKKLLQTDAPLAEESAA